MRRRDLRRRDLREYQRQWVANRRLDWIEANGPCARCGSWDRPEVDHVDRALKEINAGDLWSLSPSNPKRIAELAKCQVLCHDCHSKKTTAERQPPLIHGLYSTYDTLGCRCAACTTANGLRQAPYRARTRAAKRLQRQEWRKEMNKFICARRGGAGAQP